MNHDFEIINFNENDQQVAALNDLSTNFNNQLAYLILSKFKDFTQNKNIQNENKDSLMSSLPGGVNKSSGSNLKSTYKIDS